MNANFGLVPALTATERNQLKQNIILVKKDVEVDALSMHVEH